MQTEKLHSQECPPQPWKIRTSHKGWWDKPLHLPHKQSCQETSRESMDLRILWDIEYIKPSDLLHISFAAFIRTLEVFQPSSGRNWCHNKCSESKFAASWLQSIVGKNLRLVSNFTGKSHFVPSRAPRTFSSKMKPTLAFASSGCVTGKLDVLINHLWQSHLGNSHRFIFIIIINYTARAR